MIFHTLSSRSYTILPNITSIKSLVQEMGKRVLLVVVILTFTFGSTNAQIKWDKGKPLEWPDFEGMPFADNYFMAYTHVDVGYSYVTELVDGNYRLQFKVDNSFLKNTSWVKKDTRTATLLAHEQLHFDINEYFTRKLYWELTNKTYTSEYQQEVKAIFASITKRLTAIQLQYDKETVHSLDKTKQTDWEAIVRQQLTETPPYP